MNVKNAIVQGKNYRFTVLTPSMIRMEYSEKGVFVDKKTQMVVNRTFDVPEYTVNEKNGELIIETDKARLVYTGGRFAGNNLRIEQRNQKVIYESTWHYGDIGHNLKGTTRTLDQANGEIPLQDGLFSMEGWAVISDKGSMLLTEDGWIERREDIDAEDLYYFGYGTDYLGCLKDYYKLTGATPILPKYALGNWWSRYYKYTEKSYLELMDRFEKENIPFTVGVIDMDWHLTEIDQKYGAGWTGYTWNKELFPDPKEFMTWLHDHGLKVTLNVHPAGGVQAHEEKYKEMAEAMGRDWEKEEPVNFDVTDQKFLKAYFEYLHHPNEEEGVDFWWLDWQQGGLSKIPGLDPLWMLNHYHYLDSGRRGKRRLTFSRYAGMGSHRYPVGFSGDTIISWESLAFQPYFTANASNVGYGWWSHDIGGHMKGYRDEELSTRWIQFGVFSPIMRLHSSNSAFTGKEPWNYNAVSENIMKRYLKLRHEMIPYLYTMNYHASHDGQPLIRPMYYLEPEQPEAYEVPNEYYFGTELVVCPITEPTDKAAGTACVKAWIPEGKWYDIFSGLKYDGGRMLELYRSLEDIPVLAKEGAIIPLTDLTEYTNSVENPKELAVKIVPGKKNAFILMEDTGDTCEDKEENWAQTKLEWINENEFIIHPANGNLDVIPKRRTWKMEFYGIADVDNLEVTVGGKAIETERIYDEKRHICQVNIPETEVTEQITISFSKGYLLRENNKPAEIFALLYQAKIEYEVKEKIYAYMKEGKTSSEVLGIIQAMHLPDSVYGMLSEVLLA